MDELTLESSRHSLLSARDVETRSHLSMDYYLFMN